MKKVLFTCTLLALAFSFVLAQDEEGNSTAPKMEFDKEVHNFGTIEEGTKAAYEFQFTNTGKEPLIIQNVRASCGCTTPKWPREPIMPGKSEVVKAVYNSKGRPGNFHKAITIRSNADTPTKVLYIKGKVVKELEEETSPEKKPSVVEEGN